MPISDTHVQLSGEDGNVFSIIGRVCSALRVDGYKDLAKEFSEKAMAANNYDEVLQMCFEYVEVD